MWLGQNWAGRKSSIKGMGGKKKNYLAIYASTLSIRSLVFTKHGRAYPTAIV